MSVENLADKVLIERIAAGDQQAMREAFDQHWDPVLRVCLSICSQSSDAHEVSEAVFVELWRFPNRFHPQRGSLRTYLCLLARCRAKDRLRQMSRHAEGQRAASVELGELVRQREHSLDPAETAEQKEEHDLVRTILDSLPLEFRSILVLAFFRSLSHAEIAESTGLPIGTVKSRVRRGLSKFRECFNAAKTAFESKVS